MAKEKCEYLKNGDSTLQTWRRKISEWRGSESSSIRLRKQADFQKLQNVEKLSNGESQLADKELVLKQKLHFSGWDGFGKNCPNYCFSLSSLHSWAYDRTFLDYRSLDYLASVEKIDRRMDQFQLSSVLWWGRITGSIDYWGIWVLSFAVNQRGRDHWIKDA